MIIGIREKNVVDTDSDLEECLRGVALLDKGSAQLYCIPGAPPSKRSLAAVKVLVAQGRNVWPEGYALLGGGCHLSGGALWRRFILSAIPTAALLLVSVLTLMLLYIAVILGDNKYSLYLFFAILAIISPVTVWRWWDNTYRGMPHIWLAALHFGRLCRRFGLLSLNSFVRRVVCHVESHLEDLGTPVLEDEAEPGDGRRALACKMTKEELEALVREYEGIIRIILEADREWFALSPDQNEELHKRLRGSTYEIALRIDERRRQELEEARRREEEEALRREEDQLREQQAREEREVQRQQDQQAFQTKVWAALGQLGEEAEKS